MMNSDPTNNADSPRAEYTRRLEARRATARRLEDRHRSFGNYRLGIAVMAVILAYLVFGLGALSYFWLFVPVFAFIALAVVHEQVIRSLNNCIRAQKVYERGLTRLDNRWMGSGET